MTPSEHWLGTWSAAQQLTEPGNMPPFALSQATLRQVSCVSIGGARLRVRLSNAYGDGPLELRAARLARSSGRDAIEPGSERALLFGGSPSVELAPGATLCSDPLDFAVAPREKLALTLAFGAVPNALTGHPGSRTTSFLVSGNRASAPALPDAAPVEHWYVMAGIDLLAAPGSRALVTLGDSITDGRGSTTDGNDRWPDRLSCRLLANPATAQVAVLNHGIGGNAVIRGGLGPSALERFERDVLAAPGARWLIVLEGVNDIGGADHDVSASLIEAYQRMIRAAHARGLLAYGSPILPIGDSHYFKPVREAARLTVNDWIRKSGAFDAVIDFDAALRDPRAPGKLAAPFDSGDHLHLSPKGYLRMAEVVDLGLFRHDLARYGRD